MTTPEQFANRYPHGVLTEQEGGIPNDAENYREATHRCRKHRTYERVCVDAPRPVLPVLPVPQFSKDRAADLLPRWQKKRRGYRVGVIVIAALLLLNALRPVAYILGVPPAGFIADHVGRDVTAWFAGVAFMMNLWWLYDMVKDYRMAGRVIAKQQADLDAPLYEPRPRR